MSEWIRVANFEADDAAIDALVAGIDASDGPPPGVPAKRITVLANRAVGQLVVTVRFGSKEDLDRGAAVLEGMSPPDGGTVKRVSVDVFEVLLERDAP